MKGDSGGRKATDLVATSDPIISGAAADSVALDDDVKRLPRLLRYAVLFNRHDAFLHARLIAEICELAPRSPVKSWTRDYASASGKDLANALDRRAVTRDRPELRGLADCVRLLSLRAPDGKILDEDHRRVVNALLLALRQLPPDTDPELAAEIETICFGWAALPLAADPETSSGSAAISLACAVGRDMARWRVDAAETAARKAFERPTSALPPEDDAKAGDAVAPTGMAADHLVVCPRPDEATKNAKLRELMGPLKKVIGVALPLAPVPPLQDVRATLLFEFPHAKDVIDFVLEDLTGRSAVKLRPLLVYGAPGSGKSRFVRRLGEALRLVVWRTDASRSDGAVFGGTDKRWHTAEPCHPFLAVALAGQANPLVQIEEVEKAGTRADYGRFWDCLLAFLERESASRYPDPALQTILDLSAVSYVATANTLDPLPAALRDRFRAIRFPTPGAQDLAAFLQPIVAELAAERGLDPRWIDPLNGFERDAIAAHWGGGSVRRLQRIVDTVLRARGVPTRN